MYVDQFDVMSYSPATQGLGYGWWSWFNSPLTGEKLNTPISIDNQFYQYNVTLGIPNSKLGMGISFYATGYSGTPPQLPARIKILPPVIILDLQLTQ